MYSMFKSYEKCLRYYSFNKWAQNHRSLTLRVAYQCMCVAMLHVFA